jgi:predicted amidohydrolase YtcJ
VMHHPCVVYNGHVWGHRDDDAVLIAGDRVSGIGREADFDGIHAERVDARGGSILPGFIDGHTHLLQSGLAETGWQADLSNCSRGEAFERMLGRARDRTAGDWLVASGWDESRWSPAVGLSRRDLDQVSLRVPIIAARVDGHVVIMNSAAIERVARSKTSRRSWIWRQERRERKASKMFWPSRDRMRRRLPMRFARPPQHATGKGSRQRMS